MTLNRSDHVEIGNQDSIVDHKDKNALSMNIPHAITMIKTVLRKVLADAQVVIFMVMSANGIVIARDIAKRITQHAQVVVETICFA